MLTWIEKFEDLDLEFLNSILNSEFFEDFKRSFSIVRLYLKEVLHFHCERKEEANRIYPKDKLWDEDIGRNNR